MPRASPSPLSPYYGLPGPRASRIVTPAPSSCRCTFVMRGELYIVFITKKAAKIPKRMWLEIVRAAGRPQRQTQSRGENPFFPWARPPPQSAHRGHDYIRRHRNRRGRGGDRRGRGTGPASRRRVVRARPLLPPHLPATGGGGNELGGATGPLAAPPAHRSAREPVSENPAKIIIIITILSRGSVIRTHRQLAHVSRRQSLFRRRRRRHEFPFSRTGLARASPDEPRTPPLTRC